MILQLWTFSFLFFYCIFGQTVFAENSSQNSDFLTQKGIPVPQRIDSQVERSRYVQISGKNGKMADGKMVVFINDNLSPIEQAIDDGIYTSERNGNSDVMMIYNGPVTYLYDISDSLHKCHYTLTDTGLLFGGLVKGYVNDHPNSQSSMYVVMHSNGSEGAKNGILLLDPRDSRRIEGFCVALPVYFLNDLTKRVNYVIRARDPFYFPSPEGEHRAIAAGNLEEYPLDVDTLLDDHFCQSPSNAGRLIAQKNISYRELADYALQATKRELKRRFGFARNGRGDGCMGALYELSLSGEVHRSYTIEEARRTAVAGAEIFLRNINRIKPLRPAMTKFPFPETGINLEFYVKIKTREAVGSLASFTVFGGKVVYDVDNPLTGNLETVLRESYETAKEIVAKEKSQQNKPAVNIPSSVVQKGPWEHFQGQINYGGRKVKEEKYQFHPESNTMMWVLDDFCTDLAKSSNLEFLWVGDFSNEGLWRSFGTSFFGFQQYRLDECRAQAIKMFDKMYTFLRSSPEILHYQHWSKTYNPKEAIDEIPALKDICFRITYWDRNFDRWEPPYIAEVRFLNNKFQYFEADASTQELRQVFQESYEDALAFKNG